MALPSSGNPISLNQVNVELGLSGTTTISMNQTSVRNLFGIASGTIRMSDGHGKSAYTPQALGFGLNSYYTTDTATWYDVELSTANNWDNWSPGEYVSGAGPITLEVRQYKPGGANSDCSNNVLIGSTTHGTSGVNYNNVILYPGSNSGCTLGTYNGGSTCYKAGFYYFVISNPYNSFVIATWNVKYGHTEYQCYCPGYCGTTYVCETCDYDCSGDCATGYGAVCDCDPSADDWCEPNCPCGQAPCSSYNQCNCNEECGNVFIADYEGYQYGGGCASGQLQYL